MKSDGHDSRSSEPSGVLCSRSAQKYDGTTNSSSSPGQCWGSDQSKRYGGAELGPSDGANGELAAGYCEESCEGRCDDAALDGPALV